MEGTIGSFWQNTQSEAHIPHESRIICHNLFVCQKASIPAPVFFIQIVMGFCAIFSPSENLLVAAFNKTTYQMFTVLKMKIVLKVLFGRVA